VAPTIERVDLGCASNPMRVLIRLTAPTQGLNRKGVPRKCSILGLTFNSHQQRNSYFELHNHGIDLIEKRLKRGWSEEEAVGVAPLTLS